MPPSDAPTQAALTSARALVDHICAAADIEGNHGEELRAFGLDAWKLVKAKARETRAALDAAEKGTANNQEENT